MLKPHAEIYERLCEKFDLKAEECLFVDDLQANIDGAKAVGMEGYCFAGDDLDLFGALTLNAAPDLYNLKTGQKNSACKVKLAPGYYLYVHMFEQKSVSNPSSLQLAQNLQYVWYSD